MGNNTAQLVSCPKCKETKPNAYMGSITTDGYFIVKRGSFRDHESRNFYHASSDVMIMAEKYTVFCECGYSIQVESGIIKNAFLGTYLNG